MIRFVNENGGKFGNDRGMREKNNGNKIDINLYCVLFFLVLKYYCQS